MAAMVVGHECERSFLHHFVPNIRPFCYFLLCVHEMIFEVAHRHKFSMRCEHRNRKFLTFSSAHKLVIYINNKQILLHMAVFPIRCITSLACSQFMHSAANTRTVPQQTHSNACAGNYNVNC